MDTSASTTPCEVKLEAKVVPAEETAAKISKLLQRVLLQVAHHVVPYQSELVVQAVVSLNADSTEVCTLSFKESVERDSEVHRQLCARAARGPRRSMDSSGSGSSPYRTRSASQRRNESVNSSTSSFDSSSSFVNSLVDTALKVWYDDSPKARAAGKHRREGKQQVGTLQVAESTAAANQQAAVPVRALNATEPATSENSAPPQRTLGVSHGAPTTAHGTPPAFQDPPRSADPQAMPHGALHASDPSHYHSNPAADYQSHLQETPQTTQQPHQGPAQMTSTPISQSSSSSSSSHGNEVQQQQQRPAANQAPYLSIGMPPSRNLPTWPPAHLAASPGAHMSSILASSPLDYRLPLHSTPLAPVLPSPRPAPLPLNLDSPVSRSNSSGKFSCKHCNKEFTFATNLTRHLRNIHGQPHKRKTKAKMEAENESNPATPGSTHSEPVNTIVASINSKQLAPVSQPIATTAPSGGHMGVEHKVEEHVAEEAEMKQPIRPNSAPLSHSDSEPLPEGYVRCRSPERRHKCQFCPRRFPFYRNLARHVKFIHNVELVDAEMSAKEDAMEVEETANSETSQGRYSCRICGHRFSYQSNLCRHLRRVHRLPSGKKRESGEKNSSSDSITDTSGTTDGGEELEIKDENKEAGTVTRYECDLCKARFSFQTNLIRHLSKVHQVERKDPGVKFTKVFEEIKVKDEDNNNNNVDNEVNPGVEAAKLTTKTTNPPSEVHNFSCSLCGLGFRYYGSLRRHRKDEHGIIAGSQSSSSATVGSDDSLASPASGFSPHSSHTSGGSSASYLPYHGLLSTRYLGQSSIFSPPSTPSTPGSEQRITASTATVPVETPSALSARSSSSCPSAEKGQYACNICGTSYTFTTNLNRHKRQVHGVRKFRRHKANSDDSSPSPAVEAPAAPPPAAPPAPAAEEATEPESRRRFRCDLCGQEFTWQTNLTRHKQKEHPGWSGLNMRAWHDPAYSDHLDPRLDPRLAAHNVYVRALEGRFPPLASHMVPPPAHQGLGVLMPGHPLYPPIEVPRGEDEQHPPQRHADYSGVSGMRNLQVSVGEDCQYYQQFDNSMDVPLDNTQSTTLTPSRSQCAAREICDGYAQQDDLPRAHALRTPEPELSIQIPEIEAPKDDSFLDHFSNSDTLLTELSQISGAACAYQETFLDSNNNPR